MPFYNHLHDSLFQDTLPDTRVHFKDRFKEFWRWFSNDNLIDLLHDPAVARQAWQLFIRSNNPIIHFGGNGHGLAQASIGTLLLGIAPEKPLSDIGDWEDMWARRCEMGQIVCNNSSQWASAWTSPSIPSTFSPYGSAVDAFLAAEYANAASNDFVEVTIQSGILENPLYLHVHRLYFSHLVWGIVMKANTHGFIDAPAHIEKLKHLIHTRKNARDIQDALVRMSRLTTVTVTKELHRTLLSNLSPCDVRIFLLQMRYEEENSKSKEA